MKKFLLLLLAIPCFAAENISVDTKTGKVQTTSVGTVGSVSKPFDFGDVDVTGLPGLGSSAFIQLSDVPTDYLGDALKLVRVKATEDGLEFVTVSGGTGTVTSITATSPVIVTPTPLVDTGVISLNPGVDFAFTEEQTIVLNNVATNTVSDNLALGHNTTGTPANGLGSGIQFQAESSTTTDRNTGSLQVAWSDVTHASRTAYMDFLLVNNAGSQLSKARLFGSGGFAVGSTTDPGAGIINANVGLQIGGAALNFSHLAGDFALTQTPSTTASRLIGRGDSGAGDFQEITLGTNLTIVGTTLNAGGGGDSITVDGAATVDPNFDDGGNINFTYSAPNITASVDANSIGPTEIDETGTYDWTGTHVFDSDALQIDDTDASHQLIITPNSDLTQDRVLFLQTGDANRTLIMTSNASIAGTNTGDQTSIVGITGTTAQFNTALSDADFATGGGTATGTNTGDQTSIVGITGTTAQFNTALSDGDFATLAGTEELDGKTLDSSVGKGTWTASGTWQLPAFTQGGNITQTENTGIVGDSVLSADGTYSSLFQVTGTGGDTIAFGDLVTLDKDDSRWEKVDISVAAAATGDARGIIGIAITSSSDGAAITVMLRGTIRADANFPALTIGAAVYASTTGDVVVAQPTTVDHVIRIIGFALTADSIYFCPDNAWITHT